MELVESIREDIMIFFYNNKELLFNERDFQMHLVLWLRKSVNKYDDVDLEYYIPSGVLNCKENEKTLLGNDLKIDIVVKKDGEYCPIELKYKTKKVNQSITRFGEKLNDVTVIKNQGARDLGMYNFWRDVRRVELIRNRFETVKNGLVVFLTNDVAYTKHAKEEFNYKNFSMSEGKLHPKKKCWNGDFALADKYVAFEVEKEYVIEWDKKEIEGVEFYFCVLTI